MWYHLCKGSGHEGGTPSPLLSCDDIKSSICDPGRKPWPDTEVSNTLIVVILDFRTGIRPPVGCVCRSSLKILTQLASWCWLVALVFIAFQVDLHWDVFTQCLISCRGRGFTERKGKQHCFLESSLPLWPVRGRWNPAHLQEELVFCLEGRCHKEFKDSFKSPQTLKPASWPLASEAGQGDLAFTIPIYSVLSSLYPEKWSRYKERHDFVSLNHPCLHVLKL